MPPTRPGCSKPYPAWPSALPWDGTIHFMQPLSSVPREAFPIFLPIFLTFLECCYKFPHRSDFTALRQWDHVVGKGSWLPLCGRLFSILFRSEWSRKCQSCQRVINPFSLNPWGRETWWNGNLGLQDRVACCPLDAFQFLYLIPTERCG